MSVPWRSVKVWMNAFIPMNIEGYTKPVPGEDHKGQTMIPGPFPTSDCFLTDQRDFSEFIQSKSRMHCEARLDFSGPTPVLAAYHNCDWTTECDCEDGEEECKKKGKTENMVFTLETDATKNKLTLKLNANAWNPCSPSSSVGGEIDMQAIFAIERKDKTLAFTGIVDSFPAFEAYATINDGAGTTIFRRAPPVGNTVMNLPGNAATKVEGVLLRDLGTGIFTLRQVAGGVRFSPLASRVALFDRKTTANT